MTLAEIMQQIPAAYIGASAGDTNAVVHFKFTGAEPGEWNAVIGDGKCQVAQGIPRSRPTISLTADSGDFVQIATGQMDGMRAFMEGKLKLTGDLAVAQRLIQMFKVH